MQVKSHGLAISDFNNCNNNNNSTYNSQLVNSFLNKSSPTRNHPPPLMDIVGKVILHADVIPNESQIKLTLFFANRCQMLFRKRPLSV